MLKYIDQESLVNKTVLLRVDFNVPLTHDGRVADNSRMLYAIPTIKKLLDNKNRLVLLSHLGKPKDREQQFSLLPVIQELHTLIPTHTITLLEDIISLTPPLSFADNEIMFLENIRFYPEEKKNDPKFAKHLSSLADVYVNDAFSVCHRKDASVVGIPQHIPSYGGLQLRKEITMIDKLLQNPARPFIAILGGSKISTKLPLLQKLSTICDQILIGGGMANTMLRALGHEVGKSLIEDEELMRAKELLVQASGKFVLPTDATVGTEAETPAPALKSIENIATADAILDLGTETEKHFSDIITQARTILWNGPVGLFEKPAYRHGTDAIIAAIMKNSEAFTVVGGGDTLSAIKDRKDKVQIDHISTGGGAMLTYIAEGRLPGIDALMNPQTPHA